MAYEFDIDKIQDYVQSICELHDEIMHNTNGIKSFARFQSEDEIADMRNSAGKNIVVVAAINGRRVGHKDDKTIQREMILRVVSYAENNSSSEIRGAVKRAEGIMLDIMTAMERKQEEDLDGDICGIMHYLQPENFSWEEVEDQPWLVNHYGWDLTVPFKVFIPVYDPEKWDGLPATPLPSIISLIIRFRVGAPGAPMNDGDTTYTNALLAGTNFLLLADGKAIHQDTTVPDERYCTKPFNSDTITINGGVSETEEGKGEVIEIYKVL